MGLTQSDEPFKIGPSAFLEVRRYKKKKKQTHSFAGFGETSFHEPPGNAFCQPLEGA